MFALGQRLHRFADHVTTTAETTNGERVRRWCQDLQILTSGSFR